MQKVEDFIDSELEHELVEAIIRCGTDNAVNDDDEEILTNFKNLSDSSSRDTKLTSLELFAEHSSVTWTGSPH